MALVPSKARIECTRLHYRVTGEILSNVNISQGLDVVIKYISCIHSHIYKQVMLFKPKTIDKACIKA